MSPDINFPKAAANPTINNGHNKIQQILVNKALFCDETAFIARAFTCLDFPEVIGWYVCFPTLNEVPFFILFLLDELPIDLF